MDGWWKRRQRGYSYPLGNWTIVSMEIEGTNADICIGLILSKGGGLSSPLQGCYVELPLRSINLQHFCHSCGQA